jgi:predicted dienelactone hydrolase
MVALYSADLAIVVRIGAEEPLLGINEWIVAVSPPTPLRSLVTVFLAFRRTLPTPMQTESIQQRVRARGIEMRLAKFIIAVAAGLVATHVHSAGLMLDKVPADGSGSEMDVAVWSPCSTPPNEIQHRRFMIRAVRDCPVERTNLPLIVISHGYGGMYLGHHDTAEALADAGFVVAAPNHPDDTASNEDRKTNFRALISRPSDIKRLIDYMISKSPSAEHIDPERIGFYGFSRGGYTGLVLLGAVPDFQVLHRRCRVVACDRPIDGLSTADLVNDPRINVFVIADPLSNVFPTADALKGVRRPLQLWGSEFGGRGVKHADVTRIARNLPEKADVRIVLNSSHLDFVAPCRDEFAEASPRHCSSSPGFSRAAFHKELNGQIVAYFQRHL